MDRSRRLRLDTLSSRDQIERIANIVDGCSAIVNHKGEYQIHVPLHFLQKGLTRYIGTQQRYSCDEPVINRHNAFHQLEGLHDASCRRVHDRQIVQSNGKAMVFFSDCHPKYLGGTTVKPFGFLGFAKFAQCNGQIVETNSRFWMILPQNLTANRKCLFMASSGRCEVAHLRVKSS